MSRRTALLDTNVIVGLHVAKDQHHEEAVELFRRLEKERWTFATTTDIVTEVAVLLRKYAGHETAIAVIEGLMQSRVVKRVPIVDALRERGWELYKKHKECNFSLVDCTTIAVIEAFELRLLFSFDQEFDRAGVKRIPGPR
jgi:predicted nucleic acid-binding protein